MIDLILTQNFDLKVEADRDSDNWVKIEGFDLDKFAPEWKYEVSDTNGSDILLELSNGEDLVVDIAQGAVTLNIRAGVLKNGTYYHRLFADTEDADKKFQFGGTNNLIVKKY